MSGGQRIGSGGVGASTRFVGPIGTLGARCRGLVLITWCSGVLVAGLSAQGAGTFETRPAADTRPDHQAAPAKVDQQAEHLTTLARQGKILAIERVLNEPGRPAEETKGLRARSQAIVARRSEAFEIDLDNWATVVDRKPTGSWLAERMTVLARWEISLPWHIRTKRGGVDLTLIPPGEFLVGCGAQDCSYDRASVPQHRVLISRPFYIGTFETTVANWTRVMENAECADSRPIEKKDWDAAQEFCEQLHCRLPLECEWEYACAIGGNTFFATEDEADEFSVHAWNAKSRVAVVGSRAANKFGIFDMLGNVAEWCQDNYDPVEYRKREGGATDPCNIGPGNSKVVRGGSRIDVWTELRSWRRRGYLRTYGPPDVGFRIVREVFPK